MITTLQHVPVAPPGVWADNAMDIWYAERVRRERIARIERWQSRQVALDTLASSLQRIGIRPADGLGDRSDALPTAHEKARPPVRLSRAVRQQKSETGGAFPCSGRREECAGKARSRRSHASSKTARPATLFDNPTGKRIDQKAVMPLVPLIQ